MTELETALTSFNTYLLSPEDEKFPRILDAYGDKNKKINRDFFTLTLDEHPELNPYISELLNNLNIDKLLWGRYIGAPITVYQLLKELNQLLDKKNQNLIAFIKQIDRKRGKAWTSLVLATMLGLVGVEFLVPFMTGVVDLIHQVVVAAVFVPSASLGYTAAVYFYSLYESLSSKKKVPLSELLRNNFFELAEAALKITAYSLVLAAVATTGSPLFLVLIIVGTGIQIIKELANFIHLQLKHKPSVKDGDTLPEKQQKVREACDYLKRRNSLIINIVAAVVITGVVAASFLIPGGFFVAIGALVGLVIAHLLKSLAHRYNERYIAARLISDFEALETKEIARLGLESGPDLKKRAQESHGLALALMSSVKTSKQLDASDAGQASQTRCGSEAAAAMASFPPILSRTRGAHLANVSLDELAEQSIKSI